MNQDIRGPSYKWHRGTITPGGCGFWEEEGLGRHICEDSPGWLGFSSLRIYFFFMGSFCLFVFRFFEVEFCCVAQAGLKLSILLHQPPSVGLQACTTMPGTSSFY
jgi:hypothetical protein